MLSRTGFGCTYEGGRPDAFLAALDALPSVTVALPDVLRAACIYPRYVARLAFA